MKTIKLVIIEATNGTKVINDSLKKPPLIGTSVQVPTQSNLIYYKTTASI
jgi:hypothetical protein